MLVNRHCGRWGQIRAAAAGLHHSHSHAGSPTHWARLGAEPTTSWFPVGFVSAAPRRELHVSRRFNHSAETPPTHAEVTTAPGKTTHLLSVSTHVSIPAIPYEEKHIMYQYIIF